MKTEYGRGYEGLRLGQEERDMADESIDWLVGLALPDG